MSFKSTLLFSIVLFLNMFPAQAQQNDDYKAEWKKVSVLEKKGLTKSALDGVIKIFDAATKSGNESQQIKAAMYQMKYRNMVEESNSENNIFFIDTLIVKTKAPAKNILQSMQADLFWSYKQQNRYKLYNRTTLSEEKDHDINTWSIEKLNTVIASLFKSSLKNETVLKNNSMEGLDAILTKGENTRTLRPTLYDFLAHRAFTYFTNSENDVTSPSYKFLLNDEKLFSPVNIFINTRFSTKDTTSLYYNAILLLQDILKFHSTDINPDALTDVNLIRLAFVNEHAVVTNKKNLYEAALINIENTLSNNPLSGQAMYLRAALYYSLGQQFDPFTKKETQFDIKKAKKLCDIIINKFPKSEGGINANNLLLQIQQPYIDIQTEKVNIPGQAFRSLLKYKNTTTLYLRIIKTSRDEIKRVQRDDYTKLWENITNLTPVKSWSISLPNLQDFQQHAVEIKTDGLPAGTYYILASIKPDFPVNNNFLAKQITYVSNISYISNNKDQVYILNRDNGEPLAGAEVQYWQQKYNYTTSNYEEIKTEKYISDKNGYIKLKKTKENNNYYNSFMQVKFNNEELFTDDSFYSNYYNGYESPTIKRTFFFTDRSIYRPGQIVYFKGIVLSTDSATKKSNIINDYKTSVILYDANNQKVSSIRLISNEYGSYNSSFKLPDGILNGQFYIQDSVNKSTRYFSVEEYKRPKFFVEIKKPEGLYRLNDSIKIIGNTKAYAGNNIDGAKVIYRVIREVRYPVWYWGGFYKRGPYPTGSEQMEISNGQTITNANGEFSVTFKAIPDETVDKNSLPIFYYNISADITDINGETRSSNITVKVAYQSLQLNIIAPDKLETDSIKNIKISSTNLNDLFEKSTVNVTVYKLQSPERIFRSRFWEMPDQTMMSKEESYKNFPYDVYMDEDQVSKWPIREKVMDITDTTTSNSSFHFQHSTLAAGWYKMIVTTKDKYGEDVRAEKYIQLTDNNTNLTTSNEPVTVKTDKTTAEAGEKIKYSISTGFSKIWLIHNLTKIDQSITTSYQVISTTVPFINEITTTENDRGGMNVNYAFIKHNRVYNSSLSLDIPWANKSLDVSYETFRDKILPGSEEKWKIKIAGDKSEKVAAETLISMYDASLDQFKPHSWSSLKSIWPSLTNGMSWQANDFTSVGSEESNRIKNDYLPSIPKSYDELINNGWNEGGNYYTLYVRDGFGTTATMGIRSETTLASPVMMNKENDAYKDGIVAGAYQTKRTERKQSLNDQTGNIEQLNDPISSPDKKQENITNDIQIRKNFNETAFFFPSLTTDTNGNIEFTFSVPEALTKWKMMTFAHTKELASGYAETTVITQKPLMVQPNAPRFLREGDRIEFSAKISNLSNTELTGTATLELFDAATNKIVDGWFKNIFPVQYFTIAAGQSTAVKFPVDIPISFNSALSYRIKAISKSTAGGTFSDGEEAALPVLTNRMLVTETLPLNMRNTTSKNFKFDKLLSGNNSGSLTNHALTVEYTSNPAWYAVQALPYLMEYPYECAEQSFNRYYANSLASYISNSVPKIKAVFEKWKTTDTAALMSNLQKNEELKSVLLQETPWVLNAQHENTQKKNIALLFDMVRMSAEKEKTLNKLKEMQSSNGGFTWFKGGSDDRYITQYIITGIGHLRKLNTVNNADYNKLKTIVDKAIPYLDNKIKEEYDYLIKYKVNLKSNNLSYTAIQYLYMRSFFAEYKIATSSKIAFEYYNSQAVKYWLSQSKYMQAMISLSLYRNGNEKTAKAIISSLKENAIYKEEMGMYWKEFAISGYYWYQAPIESQAMMIEAFTDIDKNPTTINDLKTWLLKQKQTNQWPTTKATAEACYALLLNGSDWLSEEKTVSINLGNTTIKTTDDVSEAGTGYFKKTIEGDKVQQGMGNITVNISSSSAQQISRSTSWGAVYWQYFEDLDKITAAETPLKLVKKLFIEKNTDKGPVLTPLNDGDELHIGDKIEVRIELRSDRDMEYIHMKDMRAACMEPVNVISQYKYQGGLSYYESTKDASTNFFFSSLPRGTYVFEYPMFVTHSGNFSNGISSIQCMYAPEFTSHSEGIRVNVADK